MWPMVFAVCLIMSMFLWLLCLLGVAAVATYSPWLAWFSVFFIAALVFSGGTAMWPKSQ